MSERGDYSAAEQDCPGCMGPCGRCHEAAPTPTREQVQLHEQYVVDHAGDHDEDCPADDTCECSMKARNDAVNAVCRYLSGRFDPPAAPPLREVKLGVIEFHSPRVNPGLLERFYAVRDDLIAAGAIVDLWLMDIQTVLAEHGYQMRVFTDKPMPTPSWKQETPKRGER